MGFIGFFEKGKELECSGVNMIFSTVFAPGAEQSKRGFIAILLV